MLSASSVGEGAGFGTEMEAMGATPAEAAEEEREWGEKWRKRRLIGGMLWMQSRQQHQQHMAHTRLLRSRVEKNLEC